MFTIIPYQSVDPIRFGMSAAELTQAVGQPIKIRKNPSGELNYQYPTFSVRLSAKEQTVVEVGLSSKTDVHFDDVDIFRSPTAFEDLIKKDGSPFEFVGFIILLKLGITLTGFHDNDPSQKAVGAFIKGRWDHLRPQFKEYAHSFGSIANCSGE